MTCREIVAVKVINAALVLRKDRILELEEKALQVIDGVRLHLKVF